MEDSNCRKPDCCGMLKEREGSNGLMRGNNDSTSSKTLKNDRYDCFQSKLHRHDDYSREVLSMFPLQSYAEYPPLQLV
ncbi:hypothetical protein LOK49_LG14G00873 [Camellia lanceoleosa]|uniref:Uncharacterized protein n=1 Tax=Camellia lanceoleosa TaxID=1840588 RepID=A0ACC0FCW3_9ERIC|nr:hypothetical protein LOK49_LG14G00873 [Camellia lanceoleosa]